MAGGRSQKPHQLDPDRCLRPHSIVVRLSRLGLGHRRRGARPRLSQALRISDSAQRSHPPDHAKGRRQRHLPHRPVDRLPAAAAVQTADTEVRIDNFAFAPQRTAVKAGTTVTWINEDDTPHTVVSSGKFFKSKALDTEDKFSFTFTTAGTYEYFCSLHPHMTGVVVVEAAAGADDARSNAMTGSGADLHN